MRPYTPHTPQPRLKGQAGFEDPALQTGGPRAGWNPDPVPILLREIDIGEAEAALDRTQWMADEIASIEHDD
jgi:hypothetical protein